MRGKFKALGLGLIVMLAAVATFAPASQAAKFRSESKSSTVLSAAQQTLNEFSFKNPYNTTVTCAQVSASGFMAESPVEKLNLSPKYEECEYFGPILTTWNMNGCEYSFTAITGSAPNYDGALQVVCPVGKAIQIRVQLTAFTYCTVSIGPQTASGFIDYTNEGAGAARQILMTSTVTSLTYEVQYVGTGSYCGEKGLHYGGKYIGSIVVKGFEKVGEGLSQVGLWVE